jgi:hypothetical protein
MICGSATEHTNSYTREKKQEAIAVCVQPELSKAKTIMRIEHFASFSPKDKGERVFCGVVMQL